MSYLTDEIRRQLALVQTCCYNIDQMCRREFEKCLEASNPNTDANVTRLDQLGNIGKLCETVKMRCVEMEVCLGIAEDMEANSGDSRYSSNTDRRQA